jgi:hypothetical protein
MAKSVTLDGCHYRSWHVDSIARPLVPLTPASYKTMAAIGVKCLETSADGRACSSAERGTAFPVTGPSMSGATIPLVLSRRTYLPQLSNLKLPIHVLQGLPLVLWNSPVYQKVQSSTGSTDIVL